MSVDQRLDKIRRWIEEQPLCNDNILDDLDIINHHIIQVESRNFRMASALIAARDVNLKLKEEVQALHDANKTLLEKCSTCS